ncbi:MAG TPA: hypothetical protein VJ183_07195 [Chloroflexia bacterium]|nr:hypothetical protein [Chloroflexia bacterium]
MSGEKATRKLKLRAWQVILATLVLLICVASALLVALMDQTTLLGNAYVTAISSGNEGLAELLGDHFSENNVANQQLLRQDIRRDLAWLGGKELSDVTATREQTLSGQWVTVVRFSYKPPNSNEAPRNGTLRVKTDKWWLLTYVRTVEVVQP